MTVQWEGLRDTSTPEQQKEQTPDPEQQKKDIAKATLECRWREFHIREKNGSSLNPNDPDDSAYAKENADNMASCQRDISQAQFILDWKSQVITSDWTPITTWSWWNLVTEDTPNHPNEWPWWASVETKTPWLKVSFVTTEDWDIKLPEWTFKDLKAGNEIQFSLEWLTEEDLEDTTYWTYLPDNVSSIKIWDKEYKRVGWEFTDEKWNPLQIKAWEKVTVWDIDTRTPEQIKQSETQVTKFLEWNPEYNKPEKAEEKWLIEKLFKNWDPFEVVINLIAFLFWWNIDFNNLSPETATSISNRISVEEKRWNLDRAGRWQALKLEKWQLPPWVSLESIPEHLRPFVTTALKEIWTNEHTRWSEWADKYLSWQNSAKIPWCAGFVNWCLKNSWFDNCATWKLTAKSFINWSWFWHVWVKLWNNILWWNQWNKVSVMPINKPIAWYAIPTQKWLEMHNFNDPKENKVSINEIPNGAIIVFDRSTTKSSDRKYS